MTAIVAWLAQFAGGKLLNALPWIALALALLGGAWMIYSCGEDHVRAGAARVEAAREREALKREREGDHEADDARRDGAAERLRDGRF